MTNLGIKSRSFLLWGHSVNSCDTVPFQFLILRYVNWLQKPDYSPEIPVLLQTTDTDQKGLGMKVDGFIIELLKRSVLFDLATVDAKQKRKAPVKK